MSNKLTPEFQEFVISLGVTIKEFTALQKIVSKLIAAKHDFNSTYVVCYSKDLDLEEWQVLLSKFKGCLIVSAAESNNLTAALNPVKGRYIEDHTGLHYIEDSPTSQRDQL